MAIERGIVQRRPPARPTAAGARRGALNGRFAASANGAPVAVLGVHVGVGIDEQSDHSAIAVNRRPVQRGHATAVHGGAEVMGVGPTGYPSTQPVPEHKTARRPRGSTWENGSGKSTPSGLGVPTISLPACASTKRAKLRKVAEAAIATASERPRRSTQLSRQEYP